MDDKQQSRERQAELIQLVRRKAQRFLDTKGVTSVGVGYRIDKETGDHTNELCIQFTVEEKVEPESLVKKGLEILPENFEDEVGNNVRVQVIERSYKPDVIILEDRARAELKKLDFHRFRRKRQNPIRPGISISHENGTAGTLGAIVFDKQTGQAYGLSNCHVLQGATGQVGDCILQPGPFDGGRRKDGVGRLVRSHLGLAGDCAVCSIEDRGFEGSVLELDAVPSPQIGKAELDDKVIKSGRTTGVTRGTVKRVGVVAKIRYSGFGERAIGAFEIRPDPLHMPNDGEVSKGGDSGSVWMMAEGPHKNVVVGLHFAGETDPNPNEEHALACNIHSIFEKLDVTFDSTGARESESALLSRFIDVSSRLPVDDSEEEEFDLTLKGVAEIQQRFISQRSDTLEYFRQAVDEDLSASQLSKALEDMLLALENPYGAERMLIASDTLESSAQRLPSDFSFPGIDLSRYPINPGRRKFEPLADLLQWIWFAGGPFVFGAVKAPFRSHTKNKSRFRYKMPDPGAQTPIEIALFSDWGTGEYQSNYISKQLENERFPLAIHLGDVYYAGRKKEFRKYVNEPLQNVVKQTNLFFLNANHEMLRGAKWYYNYLDEKQQQHPRVQQQEGSYFALESDRFQIVGIDTDYHERSRLRDPELLGWLEDRLVDGRRSGRTNILLSSNHPYKYGEVALTPLLDSDLRDLVKRKLVDLWFWGNTHYCALFNRSASTPFIGSCIGHGGFPYDGKCYGEPTPAPLEFLETTRRFPATTGLRQGRGNNGYCVMTLRADSNIVLRYLDWMSRLRAEANLSRDPAGRLQIDAVRSF